MRRAAVTLLFAFSAVSSLLPRRTNAEGRGSSVDAEPMWQSPSAVAFAIVSDSSALSSGKLALGSTLGFRLRPAVINVPAPNETGRDVNLISHALGWSLGARWGIGNGMELTALAAGLSQRGAGIKGVTSQVAPAIDSPVLQDPRIGFGYAFAPPLPRIGLKIRFEAKLPLGNAEALAGESSLVASPSLVLSTRAGGAFAALELGARLRRPSEFFGLRIGSQAAIGLGVGYEFAGPHLALALEAYALPSLIDSGHPYLPAEWLLSTHYAPRWLGNFSVGLAGGGGLPLASNSGDASLAFGVPSFRALAYVRLTPPTTDATTPRRLSE